MPTQWNMDRIWETLTSVAGKRRTITYKKLAEAAGPGISFRSIGRQYLDDIAYHCEKNGLPDLSVLVVRSGTNLPATGYRGNMDLVLSVQSRVINFDWDGAPRPTISGD